MMSEHRDNTLDDGDAELHIEVLPLRAPAANPRPTRPRPHTRLWRALIAGSAVVVALVVIFSGFLPLRTPLTGWALPQPTATSTPAPAAALLGTIPSDCPPGNPLETFSSSYSSGVNLDGLHVWLVGFDGPRATLRYTSGVPLTPYGWPHKII